MRLTISKYNEKIKKQKQLENQKREDRKKKVAALIVSIKSKLTPEELKIINFKK